MIELVGMGRAFDDVLAVEGVLSTLFFFFVNFFCSLFGCFIVGIRMRECVCLVEQRFGY